MCVCVCVCVCVFWGQSGWSYPWSTNDLDTFTSAPAQTQSLLGGCLSVVLRGSAGLSTEEETFTSIVGAPLGVHASFVNA